MSIALRDRAHELIDDPYMADAQCLLSRLLGDRQIVGDGKLPSGQPFKWRLLRGALEDEAVAAAIRRLADLGLPVELRGYEYLDEQLAWEMLARAMRDPNVAGSESNPYPRYLAFVIDKKSKKKIPSPDILRELLSNDERDTLLRDYLDFRSDSDPDPDDLAPEIAAALTAAIKKKDVTRLNDFEPHMLRSWLLSMGARLLNAPGSSANDFTPPSMATKTQTDPSAPASPTH